MNLNSEAVVVLTLKGDLIGEVMESEEQDLFPF